MVGLFSVLEALLDLPMAEILDSVPLSHEVRLALLDHTGELGRILQMVLRYEQLQWDALQTLEPPEGLNRLYLYAVQWAEKHQALLARP